MSDLPVGMFPAGLTRDDVMRKLRLTADGIERGLIKPDFLQVARAAAQLAEEREFALAARYERIARRLMPQWTRDLT